MESSSAQSLASRPQRGYSRADVDAFLASAAAERARLEAMIAAEETRARQARVTLGTHRVMVAMLLQAHREIEEIRNRAELEAAALLAGSVREAPRSPWGESPSEGPDTVLIDLTEQPASVTPLSVPSPVPHDQPHMGTPEYFDFLRGALVDDEPLGPRAD